MFRRLRRDVNVDGGFTLIELLVVVIIIGVLAAIAIPVFLNQRDRARGTAVVSDVRNAAVIMEAVFSDDATYTAAFGTYDIDNNTMTSAAGNQYRLFVSEGVKLLIGTNGNAGYLVSGTHENLTGTWTLDSAQGVPQAP